MRELSNIDMLLVILTGSVSLVANRALTRTFKANNINITLEQFVVLSYLWRKDGITQQDICNKTNKDKPSITRLVDNLENAGLVTRIADRNDRRINLIYLTKQGREFEETANSVAMEVVNLALNGLTNEQLDTCRVVLKTVLNNIG